VRIVAGLLTERDVFPWAERVLAGRITASRRQGGRESGGRPGWFIDVERADRAAKYYIRGDRGGDFGFIKEYGLQRELRLLKLLREEGIPVPEVIASSPEPNAAILGFVEGVNDFTLIESAAERDAVARDFARIMARWHAIPAAKFAEIGLAVPSNAEELVGNDLAVWERGHFPLISEPVPLVTFACRWLRRNLPAMPERLVLVQGDTGPGQFLFRDGRVQAVVDWELGALGDPMRELAHIRTRDVWYPTGNLPDWFRYYSEASGTPLDEDKIRYYSVIGMLTTALALAPVVQKLNPRDEHAEWLAQDVWSKRATAEAIAEAMGLALEPIELPEAKRPYVSALFDVVEENLAAEQLPHVQDPYLRHRLQLVLRFMARLRNQAEIGPEIEALELADMQALLGKRPASVVAGHREIDALVRVAGSDLDAELVRYFHRHAQREEALMRGGMGRAADARASAIS
jgi:aminoglycoside phosphotransferase (APT) family kinase protein